MQELSATGFDRENYIDTLSNGVKFDLDSPEP